MMLPLPNPPQYYSPIDQSQVRRQLQKADAANVKYGGNVCGTGTFASAGTAAVTFPTAEIDTNYRVVVTGSANETFWITGKTATGFTVHSSNAASTASFDWLRLR